MKIRHLSSHMLPDEVGYLRITSFMSDTLSEDVKKAIVTLAEGQSVDVTTGV